MRRLMITTFAGAAAVLICRLPAQAQTFFTYRCVDGSQFVAAFYEGDTRAHLQLDGKAIALSKRLSMSGSRYTKGDTTLRITKTGTTLRRGKRLTECKPTPRREIRLDSPTSNSSR
jgi:membrane-bound inhibitor of C-type lysozyme